MSDVALVILILLGIPVLGGALSFIITELADNGGEKERHENRLENRPPNFRYNNLQENRPNFRHENTQDNQPNFKQVKSQEDRTKVNQIKQFRKTNYRHQERLTIRKDQQMNYNSDAPNRKLLIFKNSGYYLAYDTNFLLNYPTLFRQYTKTNKSLISKQVLDELDNLKKGDNEKGYKAREAIRIIKEAKKNKVLNIVFYNKDYINSKGLDPSLPDDRIIGSYLEEKEKKNIKIFFASEDNGAQVIAKEFGLETID